MAVTTMCENRAFFRPRSLCTLRDNSRIVFVTLQMLSLNNAFSDVSILHIYTHTHEGH